jgi:hypothetical protein
MCTDRVHFIARRHRRELHLKYRYDDRVANVRTNAAQTTALQST